MKVYYEFPSVTGTITRVGLNGNSPMFYCCRHFGDIITRTELWIREEHGVNECKPTFHEHHNHLTDITHLAMSYDLPEDIAILFRLKFL